jgi:hypothetical protein
LHFVDDYLAFVQANLEHLTNTEYNNLVLRCGRYIGECIRMTLPESYDWCDYNDNIALFPQMKGIMPERMLGTCTLLVRKPDGMVLPLNKVLRFLHEGPENSVYYLACCERQGHE